MEGAVTRRLLIYPQLRQEKGIPYTPEHLARLEKLGKFPQKIKMSYRQVAWFEDEIDAWLEELAAARAIVSSAA
jgi:prophage regulatory protein